MKRTKVEITQENIIQFIQPVLKHLSLTYVKIIIAVSLCNMNLKLEVDYIEYLKYIVEFPLLDREVHLECHFEMVLYLKISQNQFITQLLHVNFIVCIAWIPGITVHDSPGSGESCK